MDLSWGHDHSLSIELAVEAMSMRWANKPLHLTGKRGARFSVSLELLGRVSRQVSSAVRRPKDSL